MTWYCLAIQSPRHKKILEKLDELDVVTYYPMRAIWRKQRTGPRVRKEYPLIPSYVFVEVDLSDTSARSILSIDGVFSFLGIRGVPSIVADDQLERVRRSEQAGDYDETLACIALLIVGQTVTIDEGPFQSFSGTVIATDGKDVELDIVMFGRTTTIKIGVDKVVAPL